MPHHPAATAAHLREAAASPPAALDDLLWEALPELTLTIAQTAALCGISVRQLGYWTHQGYVTAQGQGSRRCYGPESIRRVLTIRKAMQGGASLRQALRGLPAPTSFEGSPSVVSAVPMSNALSPREAAALKDSLVGFFAANPHTRDDARGLSIKLGRSEEDIRSVAELLCDAERLVKSVCQDITIFRSQRRGVSSHE